MACTGYPPAGIPPRFAEIAFWLHPSSDLQRITDGWPLAAALVLLGVVMMALLFPKAGTLRLAVMVYVPIIVLMGIMAMAMPFNGGLALVLPAALASQWARLP